MRSTMDLLDSFYAGSLGCSRQELGGAGVTVVTSDPSSICYAKGSPLGLYALVRPEGAVIAARTAVALAAEESLSDALVLDDAACDRVERATAPLLAAGFWFRGIRLFCEPGSFRDHEVGTVEEIRPEDDERTLQLVRRWGGKVFGQVVGDQVVSRAAVKPISDVMWDLSIDTDPDFRRRGHAKSAVSAALKYVFAHDKLAGWGCDRTGIASLHVAIRLGFQKYALDFGCVESPLGRIPDSRRSRTS